MKTDQEILNQIEAVKERDWLGTMRGDLIPLLPLSAAKPFIKDSVTEDDWNPPQRDAESIKARMLEYMPFAWDKANNNRGISAGRSLEHMSAWLWLLGHDQAAGDILEYDRYGKPQLRAICEAFEWDWRQWDDGRWVNNESDDGLPPPETATPLHLSEEK